MDRLSQLPDDILVHIWSFLTTEEAYKTRLVSKHWRRHWLVYVECLDLNTSSIITNPRDLIYYARPKNPQLAALTTRFYEWLNKVAQDRDTDRDLAPLVKLRIQSPLILHEDWIKQIDEWVWYAFARKVKSLELDFLFCFTDEHHVPSWREYRLPIAETDLTSLASLSLSGGIGISTQDIDCILLKCPLLQNFELCGLYSPFGIKITGSSLALKHLEISYCSTEHVILCNTCLVSLTLTTLDNLLLENNPELASVCISGINSERCLSLPKLGQLESCLSSLQFLTLHLAYGQVYDGVPLLKELKHLTLVGSPCKPEEIPNLIPLLNISPNIEKLVLDIIWPKFDGNMEYKKGPKVSLMHLKDIEVRDYCGEEAEDKLIRYVLEHVVAPLKRIIFDPHALWRNDLFFTWKERMNKSDQMCAELLKRVTPSSLEFIVL